MKRWTAQERTQGEWVFLGDTNGERASRWKRNCLDYEVENGMIAIYKDGRTAYAWQLMDMLEELDAAGIIRLRVDLIDQTMGMGKVRENAFGGVKAWFGPEGYTNLVAGHQPNGQLGYVDYGAYYDPSVLYGLLRLASEA